MATNEGPHTAATSSHLMPITHTRFIIQTKEQSRYSCRDVLMVHLHTLTQGNRAVAYAENHQDDAGAGSHRKQQAQVF